jgi:hypothetical protein
MQNLVTTPTANFDVRPPAGAAVGIDFSSMITTLTGVKDANALPCGSIVGDLHGGLTFTDAIAAALERRSLGGWQEMTSPTGEVWTFIVVNR